MLCSYRDEGCGWLRKEEVDKVEKDTRERMRASVIPLGRGWVEEDVALE